MCSRGGWTKVPSLKEKMQVNLATNTRLDFRKQLYTRIYRRIFGCQKREKTALPISPNVDGRPTSNAKIQQFQTINFSPTFSCTASRCQASIQQQKKKKKKKKMAIKMRRKRECSSKTKVKRAGGVH